MDRPPDFEPGRTTGQLSAYYVGRALVIEFFRDSRGDEDATIERW